MSIEAKHDLELTAIKHYCTDPSNSIIRVSESGQMAFEQSDSVLALNPQLYSAMYELRSEIDELSFELNVSASDLVNALTVEHSNLELVSLKTIIDQIRDAHH